MSTIKGFIFDFGNVLSLVPPADLMTTMAKYLDSDFEPFNQAYYKWRNHYDEGMFDQHQYWSEVARLLGKEISEEHSAALFDMDFNMWFRAPNPITVNWVNHLRESGYKLALLSNMPGDHADNLDKRCVWFPEFHHRTFSGHLRCAKPNPDIYHYSLKGLGTAPTETIFIDDNADNIAAARSLGINSVHFINAEQAADEIKTAYSIDLPL